MKTNYKGMLVNICLSIVSILFALSLSEAAARIVGLEPLYVSPERDQFWKHDPLLGWAHQPGQEGIFETPEFRTNVRINSTGLRDQEHTYEKQNENGRILVLGDSFAWGYGVEEIERYSQLLEDELDVEVINAGVSGYSTDQELLWYENEGIKYETDLVILALTGNDVGDNGRQLVSTIYYKPRFVVEEDGLVLTGYPVPKTSPQGKFIYSFSQRSALAFFLAQKYFDLRSLYGRVKFDSTQADSPVPHVNTEKEPFELTIALIDEIRNIAESRGAKFMIVTTDRWWNLTTEETYEDFLNALQAEGFLVLDVETMSGFDSETMLIPNDGHWNQLGHQFVAEKIKVFIKSQKLLAQPGP